MKVAVGISSSEQPRWGIFFESLMRVKGVTGDTIMYARGANIAENRNLIAADAIRRGFDAVWYVDDDQVFAPSTLDQLIAADKDIVSGLYLARQAPFIPHVYDQRADGRIKPVLLQKGKRGLVPAEVVGAGCLLVKTKVLKGMEKPWWRLGEADQVNWHDDAGFCMRARKAGFEVWCDQRLPVGHCMFGVVYPHYDEQTNEWCTLFLDRGKQMIAHWPAAQERPL